MPQRLRPVALLASALLVVAILENAFLGSDTPGTTKHDVSVGFFFLALASIACLLVVGVTALVRIAAAKRA